MKYRHVTCPNCGLSDDNDDKILSSKVIDKSHNGGELVIIEERKCNICQKIYKVEMHYTLKHKEIFTTEHLAEQLIVYNVQEDMFVTSDGNGFYWKEDAIKHEIEWLQSESST